MRLVHLADLHLGFRQYERTNALGVNVRESDVVRAFSAVIERTIALAPDLVLVAGDVFHHAKPRPAAVILAHREFLRLRTALPDAVIVMVSGDHDQPILASDVNIITLFEAIGIHVASRAAHRITVPALELSVLAVPKVPGARPLLEPDPAAHHNILVLHGELGYAAADDVHPWDYVALGHYHVHRVVAPRTCYAGAIEYTSTNPWGERAEEAAQSIPGKGFVVYDLDDDDPVFEPLVATRAFVDLPMIDAGGLTPATLDAAIAASVNAVPGGLDGAVVRLVVHGVTADTKGALDYAAIRRYRARALHFQLALQKPVAIRVGTDVPRARTKSLDAMVDAAIDGREIGADVDRAELKRLAQTYLAQAAEREADVRAEPEVAA